MSYKYYPELINMTTILDYFSQESIFSIIFGEDIEVGVKICSPFREDKNPGCYLEYYHNKLWFVDFADIKKTRDCFEIIKDKYNLNLQQACNFIFEVLGNNNLQNLQPNLKQKKQQKNKIKSEFLIIPKIKKFNSFDKDFWSSYYITSNQLTEDKVYSVTLFKTLGYYPNDFIIRPTNICYAYTDFKENHIKIYQPKSYLKKYKWFTNCTQNDIGNINNIPIVDKVLIITKSYKDCRILRNLGYNCIWFQNEGAFPDLKILYDLSLRFTYIYIFFDNDESGIQASQKLQNIFQQEFQYTTKAIFTPDQKYKDSGEFIQKFGQNNLKNFLNNQINLK